MNLYSFPDALLEDMLEALPDLDNRPENCSMVEACLGQVLDQHGITVEDCKQQFTKDNFFESVKYATANNQCCVMCINDYHRIVIWNKLIFDSQANGVLVMNLNLQNYYEIMKQKNSMNQGIINIKFKKRIREKQRNAQDDFALFMIGQLFLES